MISLVFTIPFEGLLTSIACMYRCNFVTHRQLIFLVAGSLSLGYIAITYAALTSHCMFLETCKCPDNIFMNWYESRPYLIKDSNGTVSGIFKEIADGMIKTSCGACNGILPMINYYVSYSGESAEKTSELNVKDRIENGYHMSFPIFGRSEMRHFMSNHIFIELVRSPGSAMIVNGAIDYTAKTINALKSTIRTWPMILIILLISLLFGILLWSVVSICLTPNILFHLLNLFYFTFCS